MSAITKQEIIWALREASTGALYWDFSDLADRIEQHGIAESKKRTETRWFWADKNGEATLSFYKDKPDGYHIKLEWSATEFEVEE